MFLLILAGASVQPFSVAAQITQYFEQPRALTDDNSHYPRILATDSQLLVLYQQVLRPDANGDQGEMYLSVLYSRDGREWGRREQRLGPFPFSGSAVPMIYSAVVSGDNIIYVAITASAEETLIFRSLDEGASFQEVHSVSTERTNVAPSLTEMSDGSVTLFVNRNLDGRQQIVYLTSRDGLAWSDARPLDRDSATGLSFLPSHGATEERDFVVYQGLNISERSTYQLYMAESRDGGESWVSRGRITTFFDTAQTDNPDLYDNQRPHLAVHPVTGELYLTWERRFQTGNPQIYLQTFHPDGEPTGFLEEVTGRFEAARSPRLTFDGDEPVLVWFTSPSGNSRIVLGRPGRFRWESETVSPAVGEASFAEALRYQDQLHLIWQRRSGRWGASVVYKEPDQHVNPPTLLASNFRAGERSSRSGITVNVQDPPDASGIRGYSWAWSQEPDVDVPKEIMQRVPDRSIRVAADQDGTWYLRVRATDFAGNWSEPTRIDYFRDTTPPGPVVFPPPTLDEKGYLTANTFEVGWLPPEDEEYLGGYSVRLDYLSSNPDAVLEEIPSLPLQPRVTTGVPSLRRSNVPDGLWLLTVAALDSVGNVGPSRALPLRTNKAIPSTRIFGATLERDRLGRPSLVILGRGFQTNGTIRQVILDRDGTPPYDYEFNLWQDDFILRDDRTIEEVRLGDVATGEYRLGLVHAERGITFAAEPLRFTPQGVIQFGDFRPRSRQGFTHQEASRYPWTSQDLVYGAMLLAAGLLMVISLVRLYFIGREITRLNREARSLVTGRAVDDLISVSERAQRMKVQGIGLRIKFAFFVVLLVASVVLGVSVSLIRTVRIRQEGILVGGLQERIELLLEGQVTGARPALQNPQLNLDQLQNLTEQGEAMGESLYVTITGLDDLGNNETVFATSDPKITAGDRVDTDDYIVGVSKITDEISPLVEDLAVQLNGEAHRELGEIPGELEELSRQAQQMILRGAGEDEIARIDQVRNELLQRARARLADLAGPTRSYPVFDPERISSDQTTFVFYRPVLEIVPGADASFRDYYRGTIRVAVTTQPILDEMAATQRQLVIAALVVAGVAVALGILGAYILATVIVIPITKLVNLVEIITETEDKASLKETRLSLKGRDELKVLADSINTMTQGLVKAAEANKDLLFGKETQKAFIPLKRLSDDVKHSYGEMDVPGAYFFGYYEGAKGVSGDYFTYQKLSDRFYAMIKCDVAGKGIPAALIMVQVATVFQNYFRGWTVKSPGLDLSSMVLRVNDVVAAQQFKGRFAALTAGILDVKTGAFYTANAGDNQLHIYREASRTVDQLAIPGGPASGMFSSDDMPVTFPQEMKTVSSGDVLLLFTDGVEEAKRLLRNKLFQPMVVTQDMIDKNLVPQDLGLGHDGEEFTIQRIHDIIVAVQTGGRYRLEKILNPLEGEVLEFDFSTCDPGGKDLTLAVIAAEKIFRLYRDPAAGPRDRVRVDRLVDQFLEKHFLQYREYFGHPEDSPSEEGGSPEEKSSSERDPYRTFSHLREDEQYDDLTMLVVRRK
ncbi:SpoIIE family protein phosphatase [Alkalispirochaeta americana]|nr:SpoIIE family protein phosphatase [Alkalispirochaeta americana]